MFIDREGPHDWEKQNLVTIQRGRKIFDIIVCKKCGLKGKVIGLRLDKVDIGDSIKSLKKINCKKLPVTEPTASAGIVKRIKITKCGAYGKQFVNITPNSIHQIIDPPHPYSNDVKGVWVMGAGEPVKVLKGEFVFV